ncbi:MAG: bcp [Candidatus Krumholzibacteriota bacterium]|jgi:peroxiredoxin Q/BCP|nr:bcp [Candidatus Krumholzibacteriota bacterium]
MDGIESHRRFKEKYQLPFPLLSDPDGKVCKKYGVVKQKTMYGKSYQGIERSTFIVGAGGKIEHAFRGVKVEGHIRNLLELLKA